MKREMDVRSQSATAGLNAAQAEAVHTLAGPLLVLAGAGTGKTRVVTVRIAELIRTGISPERILAVTFTNKAAKEMQERVSKLLPKRSKKKPLVATFHSLCVRILRRHADQVGYPLTFGICDRSDQESYARQALREIRVANEVINPNDLLSQISRWKNSGTLPDRAARLAETTKEHYAASAYRRYQTSIKAAGALDFDDLLLVTEELFEKHPLVKTEESGRFDHLLVDEYQDTNGSQYRIIKALALPHRNLCVVGDDDQSIYGWRGAEVEHILRFHEDWTDATVVRLEENYRCTGQIIKLANQLILFNKTRHDKVLRPARGPGERPRILQFPNETKEAEQVVNDIRQRCTLPDRTPGDFSILFRTNEQPRPFETELRKAKIPYVLIGGMSFFDRREVRDVMAYMRLLVRPEDETSLLRIANTPPRGLGKSVIQKILDSAVKQGTSVWELMKQQPSELALKKPAREGIANLQMLVEVGQQLTKEHGLTTGIRRWLERIKYYEELQRIYPEEEDRETRWATVEQVINSLAEYERDSKEPKLIEFLDNMALGDRQFDDEKSRQLNRDAVVLMTLHSAKGLEFPEVYLVGLEETILPHHRSLAIDSSNAIDEERRLCYVGLTRAQERLTLSMSLTRMKWGKPKDTQASRFLFEMTGQAERAEQAARERMLQQKPRRMKRAAPRKQGVPNRSAATKRTPKKRG